MKKVSKIFAAVLCVCLSILTFTACSKYNALLKAFEKEGYKEVTTYDDKDSEKAKKDIEEKDSAAYRPCACARRACRSICHTFPDGPQ